MNACENRGAQASKPARVEHARSGTGGNGGVLAAEGDEFFLAQGAQGRERIVWRDARQRRRRIYKDRRCRTGRSTFDK
jgi:hypothetical protein